MIDTEKTELGLDEQKKAALAKFLECDPDDLNENGEHYGMTSFSYGSKEYAVATDSEADDAASLYIKDSVWGFNKNFIDAHSKAIRSMPEKAFKAIQELCEDANDSILAMIDDVDHFIDDAIRSDGRGGFLSGYDGEENEEGEFFIYRTN